VSAPPPRREERPETLRRYEPHPISQRRPSTINAAAWLQSVGYFGWLSTFLGVTCMCSMSGQVVFVSNEAMALGFMGGIVALCTSCGVIMSGASTLRRGQLSGLVWAAGVLALLLGIKDLVQSGLVLLILLTQNQVRREAMDCVIGLVVLGLSLAAAVSGIVAGIKTLSVLRDRKHSQDAR